MRKFRIVESRCLRLCAVALGLLATPNALAAADAPSGAVDHSREHYTLDGSPTDEASATQSPHVCSAAATADGTVQCFSSVQLMNLASAAALRRGELPIGYLGIPPGLTREGLAQRFDLAASQAAVVLPTPGVQTASQARSRKETPKAHKADGYSCTTQSVGFIYTDADFRGTFGSQGWTGQNHWLNYSSTYDNRVSSFWNSTTLFDSRWHDYAYGGGAYYGNGWKCRYVNNLAYARMTDSGTANDRFSSFADW